MVIPDQMLNHISWFQHEGAVVLLLLDLSDESWPPAKETYFSHLEPPSVTTQRAGPQLRSGTDPHWWIQIFTFRISSLWATIAQYSFRSTSPPASLIFHLPSSPNKILRYLNVLLVLSDSLKWRRSGGSYRGLSELAGLDVVGWLLRDRLLDNLAFLISLPVRRRNIVIICSDTPPCKWENIYYSIYQTMTVQITNPKLFQTTPNSQGTFWFTWSWFCALLLLREIILCISTVLMGRCVEKASATKHKILLEVFVQWYHWQTHSQLVSIHIYALPEDNAAPDEDTDMDLVADRLVLLSLPVKDQQFTGRTTVRSRNPVIHIHTQILRLNL